MSKSKESRNGKMTVRLQGERGLNGLQVRVSRRELVRAINASGDDTQIANLARSTFTTRDLTEWAGDASSSVRLAATKLLLATLCDRLRFRGLQGTQVRNRSRTGERLESVAVDPRADWRVSER